MGWARLDDGWHDHPKVIEAGCEAAGLWVMCLTWAHANRRDDCTPGHIPAAVAARFAGSRHRRLTATLVRVGLLDLAEGGWIVHDFTDYLPKYDPKQASMAGRAGARKRWGKGGAPPPDDPSTDSEPPREPPNGLPPDRVADQKQTHGTRASARRNPVPVPTTTSTNVNDHLSYVDARDDQEGQSVPGPHRSSAGAIAAHYGAAMPTTDHGKALRAIAQAIDAGHTADAVLAAVDRLIAERNLCTPNTLTIALLGTPESWRPANGPTPGRGKPGNPYLDDMRAAHGTQAVTDAVAAMCDAAEREHAAPHPPLRAVPALEAGTA